MRSKRIVLLALHIHTCVEDFGFTRSRACRQYRVHPLVELGYGIIKAGLSLLHCSFGRGHTLFHRCLGGGIV